MPAVLLCRLTPTDRDKFHNWRVPYSGSTAEPHGELGHYIATFDDQLTFALQAMGWTVIRAVFVAGQLRVFRAESVGIVLPHEPTPVEIRPMHDDRALVLED